MGEKEGLFFLAFAKSIEEFESSLDRMTGINVPDGTIDNIFQISTCVCLHLDLFTLLKVTGNYYYVPSLKELQDLKGRTMLRTKEEVTQSLIPDESQDVRDTIQINIEYWYAFCSPFSHRGFPRTWPI